MYYDKFLKCACGQEFVWTAGEQEFMDNLLRDGKIKEVKTPVRCRWCKDKKKEKFADRNKKVAR
jgi:hypothetical protein